MRLYATTGESVVRIEPAEGGWKVTTAHSLPGLVCLALDPGRPGTLYAGSEGQGLWASHDQGRTWPEAGLGQPMVLSVAVSPADGAVYAGCEPSMIFRSRDGGRTWQELEALRTIPSAPTWSFPPRPWTSHVRWIAPNPHEADLLLAGIELGGVMLSADGGASWEDHRPGAQRDAHALAWHPAAPGRAYEAAGGGAAWSRDGGRTWQPADAGRDRHYTWALAVDPNDPECWYVSAARGPREAHYAAGQANARLYRWRGQGPWQALDGGLPQPLDSMPYALATAADHLFAGLRDGRIYLSRDGGDSWEQLRLHGDSVPGVRALVCDV
jgi:photosystem II stability/assembly factor-like uncharacterized protein